MYLPQYTLNDIYVERDPAYLRHGERTDALRESFIEKAYASTLVMNTFSSKFNENGLIYKQYILFQDFVFVAKDKDIKLLDAVDYVIKNGDVHIACNCKAYKYWAYEYMGTQLDYTYGPYRINRQPKRNNVDLRGTVCKHCSKAIEWVTAHTEEVELAFMKYYKTILDEPLTEGVTISKEPLRQLILGK